VPNGKGFGVMALDPIEPGSFVCEYTGVVNGPLTKNNYFLMVVERFGKEKELVHSVDAQPCGNVGRYVNHACGSTANCSIECVRVRGPRPFLCLFAKRRIHPDEEVFFDYSCGSPNILLSQTPCLCGDKQCLGFLPTFS
jgi:SET domain-containing protein